MEPITEAIARVALGLQVCAFFIDLNEERDWGNPNDIHKALRHVQNSNNPISTVVTSDEVTTMREFVRGCFAEMGIDIEFSGKGEYERAVIIDIDEDRLTDLGLDADVFRFGETVVRVEQKHGLKSAENA